LNPASINDATAESKVKALDVFGMSTGELFAKYPNPGALLQQLEGRNRNNANQNPNQNSATPQDPSQMTQAEQRERREKIQELYRKYDLKPAQQIVPQIVANRVLRAVYSERQLQEVMVDFWQNHFNVYAGKACSVVHSGYERDVLRKNALGNFRDLVVGTAQHPAMLFYLDNFESVSPNAQAPGNGQNAQRLQQYLRNGGRVTQQMREQIRRQTGATDAVIDQRMKEMQQNPQAAQQRQRRGINENYARELMELHTLGVDGGYTQKDIIGSPNALPAGRSPTPAAIAVRPLPRYRGPRTGGSTGSSGRPARMSRAVNSTSTGAGTRAAQRPYSGKRSTRAA
jgi:parvulin-like peptidyl-prolyl isomerase